MITFDSAQSALAFLNPQLSAIEAGTYMHKLPAIRYVGLVPIDTSANPYAVSVIYYSGDIVGEAKWLNPDSSDTPFAEINREQHVTTVHQGGIGFRYNDVELMQAKLLGIPLTPEKGIAARKVAERLIDKSAMEGVPSKGMTGLFNSPNVSVVAAAAAGGVTGWIGMDAPDVLKDFNSLLTGIYLDSDTVEQGDTVLLPVATFAYLSSTPFNNFSAMTLLDYLHKSNTYTAETGLPLTIRGVRGLDTAGVGGTTRAIAYMNDKDVVRLHLPMPFQFGNARETAPWVFEVPGRFRVGGVDVRRPGAMRYMDNV